MLGKLRKNTFIYVDTYRHVVDTSSTKYPSGDIGMISVRSSGNLYQNIAGVVVMNSFVNIIFLLKSNKMFVVIGRQYI